MEGVDNDRIFSVIDGCQIFQQGISFFIAAFTAVINAKRHDAARFQQGKGFGKSDLLRDPLDSGRRIDQVELLLPEIMGDEIVIDDGKIAEEATPDEFFSNPKNPRLKDFLSKVL